MKRFLKTKSGITLIVLVAFLLGREGGAIGLDICVKKSVSFLRTEALIKIEVDGAFVTRSTTILYGNDGLSWIGPLGEIVFPSRGPTVRAEITRLETSGMYWVPLIKNGRADFKVVVSSSDDSVHGEFEGHVELEVRGFCSAYSFRSEIHDQVFDLIRRTISH